MAVHAKALKNASAALSLPSDEPLATINRWHGLVGLYKMEGFMRPEQASFFDKLLTRNPHIRSIAETGFNGSHSSFIFLNATPLASVTSFDIAEHPYAQKSKDYIDRQFPGRHHIVYGDSTSTVPSYVAEHPDDKFDLIFIDGGHDPATAKADVENMRLAASPNNIVVMDDYSPLVAWGVGPSGAWDEAVRDGVIQQHSIHSGDRRSWAVGHYINSGQ